MATIDPNHEIQLTDEHREKLVALSKETGMSWQYLLSEFLAKYQSQSLASETDANAESAYDALDRRGLIGCISDGPSDLSTNPAHMEGFGTHRK